MCKTLMVLGTAGALGSFDAFASANPFPIIWSESTRTSFGNSTSFIKNGLFAFGDVYLHNSRLAGSFQIEISFSAALPEVDPSHHSSV